MKLICIGTSHGYPEKTRRCSSLLVEVKNSYYVIDTGTSVEEVMTAHSLPIDNIKGIFITHAHGDHIGALTTLVNNIASYHKGHRVALHIPEKQVMDAFLNWVEALHFSSHNKTADWKEESVLISQAKEGLLYEDENVKVWAVRTDHAKHLETFAYVFEAEGKRILFTGDLSGDFHDYPQIAYKKYFDAIVCELTHLYNWVDDLQPGVLERLSKSNTERFIFSHVYPKCESLLKERYPEVLGKRYEIAQDGDVFEIH